MAALLINVADMIVSELNARSAAGGFSLSFVAERSWQPIESLKTFTGLKVLVVPGENPRELAGRGGQAEETVQVDVGVLAKLTASTTAQVDPWVNLCDEIAVWLLGGVLATVPIPVRIAESAVAVPLVPENLKLFRVFTGVVRLRCEGMR